MGGGARNDKGKMFRGGFFGWVGIFEVKGDWVFGGWSPSLLSPFPAVDDVGEDVLGSWELGGWQDASATVFVCFRGGGGVMRGEILTQASCDRNFTAFH